MMVIQIAKILDAKQCSKKPQSAIEIIISSLFYFFSHTCVIRSVVFLRLAEGALIAKFCENWTFIPISIRERKNKEQTKHYSEEREDNISRFVESELAKSERKRAR